MLKYSTGIFLSSINLYTTHSLITNSSIAATPKTKINATAAMLTAAWSSRSSLSDSIISSFPTPKGLEGKGGSCKPFPKRGSNRLENCQENAVLSHCQRSTKINAWRPLLSLKKRGPIANVMTSEGGDQLHDGVDIGKLRVMDVDPNLAFHEDDNSGVDVGKLELDPDSALHEDHNSGGDVGKSDPDSALHEDHNSGVDVGKLELDLAFHEDHKSGVGIGKLKVIEVDPGLAFHEDHLQYRYQQYVKCKQDIEKFEGGLEKFSSGYLNFGFNRQNNCIVYREWAPAAQAAQLIGDFNSWDGSRHQMQKNEFGVWTLQLPDINGKPAISHRSRVKIRMQRGDGTWLDRIPTWIKWATVDPNQFGAAYDGIYWDPPAAEKYEFRHSQPSKPAAPRIYEAHVGMSSVEPRVASYIEFADNVLPRIKSNNYNTVQLMAVMEHSYYGSFGYHVTNFFAVSSRSGTPEELKYLIDKAHSLGLRVLMDVVHSHASGNVFDGLNGYDFGPGAQPSYFHTGDRGYHRVWDSRLFNYRSWEVQRFLLSNLRWWLEEFRFDGFRFDGITSMLYHHHGLNMSFTGNYSEYFGLSTDVEAVVYLMLANDLIHGLFPEATVIAEDVSGMPALCRPVHEGGVGFDYRLAMGIPDKWIRYLKSRPDEKWSMKEITDTLLNRRYTEKCVAYAESHDQSLVGDKTFAFLLMDKEMYTGMSTLNPLSPVIDRGISLHKMIHFLTMALGGEGYLNFMGNEFGHPEWVDFPREGNRWSYDKCRRRWDLLDVGHLRYKFMNNFDRAMNELDERFHFLASTNQAVFCTSEKDKTIVFDAGDLVFVFNFHPINTYSEYKVGCDLPGKYRVALDSDNVKFGGYGRVGDVDHFTSPEGEPGKPETNFNNRPNSLKVLSPPRTCQVYYKIQELSGPLVTALTDFSKTEGFTCHPKN